MSSAHHSAKRPAKKQPTNLSIDSDLIARAKALGLNVSAVVEDTLRARIRDEEGRRWLAENKEAIEALNRQMREHGLWSDGVRLF